MKKTFTIDWPENCNPELLNKELLEACLLSETYVANVKVIIEDVSCQHGVGEYNEWIDDRKEVWKCIACKEIIRSEGGTFIGKGI